MSVVRNSFNHTMSSTALITHVITGLNTATSSTNISVFSAEASLYFAKAILQTLLDAGYEDATLDETTYAVTVLGFTFYPIVRSSAGSWALACPYIYTQHQISNESMLTGITGSAGALNASGSSELSFNIIVRGDGENVVAITLGSYASPDTETPLMFVAKAKNLFTLEDAFMFEGQPVSLGSTIYLRNKNTPYVCYDSVVGSDCNTYYAKAGLTTSSKMICMPVFAHYGSFLVKGVLQCDSVNFTRGKYYQIGSDKYYALGQSGYLLMKVS